MDHQLREDFTQGQELSTYVELKAENTLSVNRFLSVQSGFSGKQALDDQPFKGPKELATLFPGLPFLLKSKFQASW